MFSISSTQIAPLPILLIGLKPTTAQFNSDLQCGSQHITPLASNKQSDFNVR